MLPKPLLGCLLLLGLAACTTAGPVPGTVEYAAATVSRGYDCGLHVDRGRIIARLGKQERASFLAVNASYAVKSYKAPHACGSLERERAQGELAALSR